MRIGLFVTHEFNVYVADRVSAERAGWQPLDVVDGAPDPDLPAHVAFLDIDTDAPRAVLVWGATEADAFAAVQRYAVQRGLPCAASGRLDPEATAIVGTDRRGAWEAWAAMDEAGWPGSG